MSNPYIWNECWACGHSWNTLYKEKVCPACGSDEVTSLGVTDE